MKKKLFLLQFLFTVFFACSGYAQQNDYAVNFKNLLVKMLYITNQIYEAM